MNNSRSKENKTNPDLPSVDTGKWEACAKVQQKTLNSMLVEARQNFQFFRQLTWFLKNNVALPKFSYDIFL